ncbi:hypothetical protein [Streptomyces triticirhizae]|uniref:hypothetical protein n=1 Tax=Streptomyces triticirhizae TaxID=2483353 RepID=UPI001F3DF2C2|nr:hypothetical protein [Streptomyces triticirhizae]
MSDLLNLPALYSDCDRGTGPEVVRVIRRIPRKSATVDSISPAAAEIRAAIRTVLASWSGLVVQERGVSRPARDIPALSRFLCRHIDWLTRHPAAGDLMDEIRELTRRAHHVAYPDRSRRVPLGYCPVPECEGELVARMRSRDDALPSDIACSISPHHSWPATSWTRLARQVRRSQGESA